MSTRWSVRAECSGDLTWEQARAHIAAKYGLELPDESPRRARRTS